MLNHKKLRKFFLIPCWLLGLLLGFPKSDIWKHYDTATLDGWFRMWPGWPAYVFGGFCWTLFAAGLYFGFMRLL